MISSGRTICAALGGLAALFLNQTVYGIVTTIDGSVTAEVKEFIGTIPGDLDFAFQDLSDTTQTLPLVALAQLAHLDGSDQTAGARAQTTFSDPRLSTLPDPEEFAIDLALFSRSSSVTHTGHSMATETRDITFLSEELSLDDGTAVQAQSQFFLDGVVLLWGEAGQVDLRGTTANVTLKVQQSGGSLASPVDVFQAGLTLTGNADGSVSLTASGQLQPGNVIVVNLTGQIPQLGPVHLLIIPKLAAPYTYDAKVGEGFKLNASVDGQVANRPLTGGAITLGVPLLQLAALVNSLTGGDVGNVLQQIIQTSLDTSGPPADPLNGGGTGVTVQTGDGAVLGTLPPCGLLGIESLVGMTGLGLIHLTRRRG